MAATAADVLATRTLVLERTVTTLERVKHGALARATKAKAEHLATVAQGVEGKLEYVLQHFVLCISLKAIGSTTKSNSTFDRVTKLEIAASIYTPETLAALTRYGDHLRKTRDQLEERRMMAIEELRDYGDVDVSDGSGTQSAGDGGTLAEIARRYGALAREVETVKMEIARLGE
jgi:diphthamide biosynthesis protein 3